MSSNVDVQRVVDALYEAYNSGDSAAAAALYADSGSHHEIAQATARTGREDIRAGLEHFLGSFPDARWEPLRRVIGTSMAAVTYRLTGTLQGQLGPFSPEGQRLDLQGVHVFEVANGEIQVSEDYWDAATFGRQMKQT